MTCGCAHRDLKKCYEALRRVRSEINTSQASKSHRFPSITSSQYDTLISLFLTSFRQQCIGLGHRKTVAPIPVYLCCLAPASSISQPSYSFMGRPQKPSSASCKSLRRPRHTVNNLSMDVGGDPRVIGLWSRLSM